MQTGNSKGSTIVIMLLGVAFWMSAAQLNGVYATTNNDDNVVTGDVINSKYLAITYHTKCLFEYLFYVHMTHQCQLRAVPTPSVN